MKLMPVYNIAPKNTAEVDIYLYGVIGESWDGKGNPADQFVKDFTALEKQYPRINIRINGPGGSVNDGLPMFRAIKASKADTHTYNDGTAFSMSAILLLAGKTVHATRGSLLMLHNVSSIAMGNAQDMRETAENLDVYDEVLTQLIADKTGKSVDEVQQEWMNYEDNFMTSTKAYECGLVDVLENYEAEEIPEDINNLSMGAVMAHYQPTSQQNPENNMSKKFLKLEALVGRKADAITDADINAVVTEVADYQIEGISIVRESTFEALETSAALVPVLQNKVTAHEATIAANATTITAHEAKIKELEDKVAADAILLAKPADAANTPAANPANEKIPGTGPVDEFIPTSVDKEKAAMRAQW